MSEHSFIMNIVWHRIVRPEGAFVREDTDGGVVEYGPMPEAMMLPLIAERKVFFESLFARQVETMLDRQTAYPMV